MLDADRQLDTYTLTDSHTDRQIDNSMNKFAVINNVNPDYAM